MTTRRSALVGGLLYLVTFAASIPALALLSAVLDGPAFVTGAGAVTPVLGGIVLDLVNAAACIGTAVVLYPVLRRTAPAGAMGFVVSRTMEAAIIAVGVLALLAVVSLRLDGQTGAGATVVAAGLVSLRDWSFLLGPGLMPAVNACLLGTALFRARMVPRAIPLLGLFGAPLQAASVLATVFGVNTQISVWSAVAVIPIFLWELSLGLWLTFRGWTGPRGEAVLAAAD
mgnify:CR=1 FL=1